MHLAPFELLLPVKQAARGRASKQTATPVDQQGSPFSVLQGSGQLASHSAVSKKQYMQAQGNRALRRRNPAA